MLAVRVEWSRADRPRNSVGISLLVLPDGAPQLADWIKQQWEPAPIWREPAFQAALSLGARLQSVMTFFESRSIFLF